MPRLLCPREIADVKRLDIKEERNFHVFLYIYLYYLNFYNDPVLIKYDVILKALI